MRRFTKTLDCFGVINFEELISEAKPVRGQIAFLLECPFDKPSILSRYNAIDCMICPNTWVEVVLSDLLNCSEEGFYLMANDHNPTAEDFESMFSFYQVLRDYFYHHRLPEFLLYDQDVDLHQHFWNENGYLVVAYVDVNHGHPLCH